MFFSGIKLVIISPQLPTWLVDLIVCHISHKIILQNALKLTHGAHSGERERNFTLLYKRILWSVYENICMSERVGDREKERMREKRLKRGKKEQPKNAAFKNVNSEFIPCGSSGSPSSPPSSYNSNGLVKMRNCQNGCYFLCALPNQRHTVKREAKALQFLSLLSTLDEQE